MKKVYTGATESRQAKMSRVARDIEAGRTTFGQASGSGQSLTGVDAESGVLSAEAAAQVVLTAWEWEVRNKYANGKK